MAQHLTFPHRFTAFVALAICALTLTGNAPVRHRADTPTLHVASWFNEYGPGARPTLIVWLAHDAGSTWLVDTQAVGTVFVASLTRDGKPVDPEVFEEGDDAFRGAPLHRIGPGDSVPIIFPVFRMPNSPSHMLIADVDFNPPPVAMVTASALAARDTLAKIARRPLPADSAVSAVSASALVLGRQQGLVQREALETVSPRTRVFRLTRPGVYEIVLQYRYSGPDEGQPDVLRDVLTSNPVTFTLL